ncbi:MAG: hypothetical protein ACOCV1_06160 [Bacillota bacterium]
MSKLEKLKSVNDKINKLLYLKGNKTVNNYLNSNQIYECVNNETHCEILNVKKLQKTELIEDDTFKRIVCLKGKISVYIPKYNENIILTSPNTLLIPPKTKHTIESLYDSQLIFIYRTDDQIASESLAENKTIYNKI